MPINVRDYAHVRLTVTDIARSRAFYDSPTRAELDAAVAVLDGLKIAHGGIKDIGAGHILEFRDPDNVALELFAAA